MLMALGWQTAKAYDFMVNCIAYNKNSDGTSVMVIFFLQVISFFLKIV